MSSVYNPQTDGQIEVVNRTLTNMIYCLVKEHRQRWYEVLNQAEFTCNSMINRSTGHFLFNIIYTKTPNQVVDLTILPKPIHKTADLLSNDFTLTLKEVRTKLIDGGQNYKQLADKKRLFKEFKVGDLVMIYLRNDRSPAETHSKLNLRKLGPFPITRRINENAYVIILPLDLNISPTFNNSDIYQYHRPNNITIAELETMSSEAGEHTVELIKHPNSNCGSAMAC